MLTYKRRGALLIMNVLLGVIAAYAFFASELDFFYVAFLMFAVSLMPHILKAGLNFHIPLAFVYAAVCFIYATVGLGELRQFYDRFFWWDSLLHFSSAVVLGIVGFLILYLFRASKRLDLPNFLLVLFGFSFAIAIGAVWEIIEFIIDNMYGTNLQVGSLDDTMWDLIVNFAGALLAATAGYLYLRHFSVPIVEEIVDEFTHENTSAVRNA